MKITIQKETKNFENKYKNIHIWENVDLPDSKTLALSWLPSRLLNYQGKLKRDFNSMKPYLGKTNYFVIDIDKVKDKDLINKLISIIFFKCYIYNTKSNHNVRIVVLLSELTKADLYYRLAIEDWLIEKLADYKFEIDLSAVDPARVFAPSKPGKKHYFIDKEFIDKQLDLESLKQKYDKTEKCKFLKSRLARLFPEYTTRLKKFNPHSLTDDCVIPKLTTTQFSKVLELLGKISNGYYTTHKDFGLIVGIIPPYNYPNVSQSTYYYVNLNKVVTFSDVFLANKVDDCEIRMDTGVTVFPGLLEYINSCLKLPNRINMQTIKLYKNICDNIYNYLAKENLLIVRTNKYKNRYKNLKARHTTTPAKICDFNPKTKIDNWGFVIDVSPCGTGKTFSAIKRIQQDKNHNKMLGVDMFYIFLANNRAAVYNLYKMVTTIAPNLKVAYKVEGTSKDREEIIARADVYIATYDSFIADTKYNMEIGSKNALGRVLDNKDYYTLICDELDAFVRMRKDDAKTLASLGAEINKAYQCWVLSATIRKEDFDAIRVDWTDFDVYSNNIELRKRNAKLYLSHTAVPKLIDKTGVNVFLFRDKKTLDTYRGMLLLSGIKEEQIIVVTGNDSFERSKQLFTNDFKGKDLYFLTTAITTGFNFPANNNIKTVFIVESNNHGWAMRDYYQSVGRITRDSLKNAKIFVHVAWYKKRLKIDDDSIRHYMHDFLVVVDTINYKDENLQKQIRKYLKDRKIRDIATNIDLEKAYKEYDYSKIKDILTVGEYKFRWVQIQTSPHEDTFDQVIKQKRKIKEEQDELTYLGKLASMAKIIKTEIDLNDIQQIDLTEDEKADVQKIIELAKLYEVGELNIENKILLSTITKRLAKQLLRIYFAPAKLNIIEAIKTPISLIDKTAVANPDTEIEEVEIDEFF